MFPEDGEAYRYNKIAEALDVSHVHLTRYLSAADYAIREVMSVQHAQPPTVTKRYYAREQNDLTSKINSKNQTGDRSTYPIRGLKPEPEVYAKTAPMTVGEADPAARDEEAIAWVSSNYVTGFRYRWDRFHAPVAGKYRIKFSGYSLWVGPQEGSKKHLPDFTHLSPAQQSEPVPVYKRDGVLNRNEREF